MVPPACSDWRINGKFHYQTERADPLSSHIMGVQSSAFLQRLIYFHPRKIYKEFCEASLHHANIDGQVTLLIER